MTVNELILWADKAWDKREESWKVNHKCYGYTLPECIDMTKPQNASEIETALVSMLLHHGFISDIAHWAKVIYSQAF